MLNGPSEHYDDNGQLLLRETYKDGRQNYGGPFESYHRNGEVYHKGTYKDGKKCGEWIEDGETVTYDPC